MTCKLDFSSNRRLSEFWYGINKIFLLFYFLSPISSRCSNDHSENIRIPFFFVFFKCFQGVRVGRSIENVLLQLLSTERKVWLFYLVMFGFRRFLIAYCLSLRKTCSCYDSFPTLAWKMFQCSICCKIFKVYGTIWDLIH